MRGQKLLPCRIRNQSDCDLAKRARVCDSRRGKGCHRGGRSGCRANAKPTVIEIDSRVTLDDAGVQDVLRRQVKQRQESIADFTRAGRPDDVAREAAEAALIESYLPQMMDREAIEALARAAIAETGVTDAKGMGQVMARLMPQVKGQADGRLVNDVVRGLLQ